MTERFPYPGDDPATLGPAMERLERSRQWVVELTSDLPVVTATLADSWTMTAADVCTRELTDVSSGLEVMNASLQSARTAVDDHQGRMVAIQAAVDLIRESYQAAERSKYLTQLDRMDVVRLDGPVDQLDARIRGYDSTMTGADADYEAQVRAAEQSAADCAVVLNGTWDPSRQYSGGSTQIDLPGIGVLNSAGLSDMVSIRIGQDAAAAASAAAAYLVATDPNSPAYNPAAAQTAWQQLLVLQQEYEGDPLFGIHFYGALPPDDALQLFGAVGMADQVVPGTTPQMVDLPDGQAATMQRLLGEQFNSATANIGGDAAQLISSGPSVPVGWLTTLLAGAAATRVSTASAGGIGTVSAAVPLMATIAAGSKEVPAGSGLLHATGTMLMNAEAGGSGVWTPTSVNDQVVWNRQPGSASIGADPVVSWSLAMASNPGVGAKILGDDIGLMDYLFTDRDWGIRDTPTPAGEYSPWPVYLGDETKGGLITFSSLLPTIIGDASASTDSARALDNLVTVLGASEYNTDLRADPNAQVIAGELRHGVSDVLADNASVMLDDVSQRDQPGDSPYVADRTEHWRKVITDLGRIGFRGEYATSDSHDRLVAAVDEALGHAAVDGTLDQHDALDATKVVGYLATGAAQAGVDAQHIADSYDSTVETLARAGQIAASHFGALGEGAKQIVDSIWGPDDNTGAAIASGAEHASKAQTQLVNMVNERVYEAGVAGIQTSAPDVFERLHDADGELIPFAQLSDEAVRQLYRAWPSQVGFRPDDDFADEVGQTWGTSFVMPSSE